MTWPVGALSQAALQAAAPGWIRSTTLQHGQLEAQTNVEVFVPNSGGRRAELIAQGYLLLVPAQVFSLCTSVLMQIALAPQGDRTALKVAAWQLTC